MQACQIKPQERRRCCAPFAALPCNAYF